MAVEPKKISALTEQERLNSLVALRGYKCFTAYLEQNDIEGVIIIQPAKVFENTIGTPTFTKLSDGEFTLAFPDVDYTNIAVMPIAFNNASDVNFITRFAPDSDYITINFYMSSMGDSAANPNYNKILIEVREYI